MPTFTFVASSFKMAEALLNICSLPTLEDDFSQLIESGSGEKIHDEIILHKANHALVLQETVII